jgi:hypothetical protein
MSPTWVKNNMTYFIFQIVVRFDQKIYTFGPYVDKLWIGNFPEW